MVFGGAIGGAAANLWQVRISPSDARLVGEPQRLTSGTGEEDPSASQDGRIAFVNPDRDWDIWSLPLDANRAEVRGEPERVVSALSDELYPSISDDGQKLAYVSDRAGNFDIWLHDLETGEDTPITITPEREPRGTISPDGSMISFVRREQDKQDLYVMDLVQRRTKLLVEGVGSMFDWMPGVPPETLCAAPVTSLPRTMHLRTTFTSWARRGRSACRATCRARPIWVWTHAGTTAYVCRGPI